MDSQKFCLKWDGFQSSVTSVFDVLRVDSELVDVTLCCEGRRVRAHRMMLSACSPYFRELFKDLPNQHLAVFLKDTSAADLNAIVEFMYKGSVNVSQSQLASFIKTAEMLQVRGLSGDDDKASPPSRHSSGHRQTAPPSRQVTPSSPLPRRPPEQALHPPPPPRPPPPLPHPSVTTQQSQHGQGQHGHQSQSQQAGQQGQKQEPSSPPAKRRRASEPNALSDQPLSSPSAGGGGSGGSSGSTASPSASASASAAAVGVGVGTASPRPASLPSAAASATADGAMPSPDDAYNQHHHQQQQHHQQQHENYHHEHDEDSNRLSHEESAHGDEMSDNHDDSMPLGGVKMEKIEPVDDDVVLDDTLDHMAELERYAADERTTAAAARGYMQHLQTRQRLTSMSAAAAAAAAVQMGAMQAGPSQRLSEDGNSQDGTSSVGGGGGGGRGRRYTCETCGQHYLHPVSLKLHRKAHEGLTTCGFCGRTLSMVASLRAHLRSVHGLSELQVRQMVPTARRRRQARHIPGAGAIGAGAGAREVAEGEDSHSQ